MTCESCGADDDRLDPVHRKYVMVGDPDRPATERIMTDVERWCWSCLTHYPHVPADS